MVKSIGLTWAFLGVLGLVASGVLWSALFDNMYTVDKAIQEGIIFQAGVCTILSIVILIASRGFLSRKLWGRKLLEIFSWIAVLQMASILLLWGGGAISHWSDFKADVGCFAVCKFFAGLMFMSMLIAFFVFMIKRLRSPGIRMYMIAK